MSTSKQERPNLILYIAELISFIFGAPIIFLIFGLILFRSGLNYKEHLFLVGAIFFLQILLPLLSILIGMKIGFIKDFDITNRKERLLPMLITITAFAFSLVFSLKFGTPMFKQLQLMIFVVLLVNSAITLFWKISLHMAANTVSIAIINMFFGWHYLWLFVLVLPLVFWSRKYLKKHTTSQLIAGILVNAAVVLGGLFLV